jgi:uncharacterized protein (TIGR02391 family)
MNSKQLENLLTKIWQIQSIMVSVSTGEASIQQMEDEYIQLYLDIATEIDTLAKVGVTLPHNNPFHSLWDWYGYWSFRLPTDASRRQYVLELYAPLVNLMESVLYNSRLDKAELEEFARGLAKLTETQAECSVQGFQMTLEGLHPKIGERCRILFETGQYDDAIFNAMNVVEEEVQDKISANPKDTGVTLISQALNPESPLLSLSKITAEQDAAHSLYRGAVGWFKSAVGLRSLNGSGPVKAFECLALGSLLMRMIDETM